MEGMEKQLSSLQDDKYDYSYVEGQKEEMYKKEQERLGLTGDQMYSLKDTSNLFGCGSIWSKGREDSKFAEDMVGFWHKKNLNNREEEKEEVNMSRNGALEIIRHSKITPDKVEELYKYSWTGVLGSSRNNPTTFTYIARGSREQAEKDIANRDKNYNDGGSWKLDWAGKGCVVLEKPMFQRNKVSNTNIKFVVAEDIIKEAWEGKK